MTNKDEKKNKLESLIESRARKLAEEMSKERKATLIRLIDKIKRLEKTIDEKKTPVIEQIGEKASGWVPGIVAHAIKGMMGGFAKLWDHGLTVRLDDEERLKPLPVIMLDVRGRPIDLSKVGQTIIPMPGGGAHMRDSSPPSFLTSGRRTVTNPGSPVQLMAQSSASLAKKVYITAPSSNGGYVYVGDLNVSAVSGSEKGVLLTPIGSVTIDINDVSKIWIDATVVGEGVTFTYVS